MAGIVSYGVYIPRYMIDRKTISSAMGWFNSADFKGEKAVANYDEDSLTMAVAAGVKCLGSISVGEVDGLYFASTTSPYREREGAAIIATALNLPDNIRTAEFANSLKAGTSALILGYESVVAKGAKNVLLCSSDLRLGKPGSSQEYMFGDGAVAFLVGDQNEIATFKGSYSIAYDFPDQWRLPNDKYNRTLEERWVRDEGYSKFIGDAIKGLMEQYKMTPSDFTRVMYPGLYPREFPRIAKSCGFKPTQLDDPLFNRIGDTGTASPLIMLANALDNAQPGDNLLVVSYGSGADALWLQVTDTISQRRIPSGLKRYLEPADRELLSYEKYLAFRGIMPVEVGLRGEVGATYLPLAWRERRSILGLVGSRCKLCGVPQFPPQRVCVNPDCKAIDNMETYPFSRRKGTLFSYTVDHLAFSVSPPQIYGVIDFDGGGRYIFDITDCAPTAPKVGMSMEMSLRRKYADEVRGIYGYFWKAVPSRD